MAHQAQKEKEVMFNIDKLPEGYAITLCFLVKGDHLLDVHVTEEHLQQIIQKTTELKEQRPTEQAIAQAS
jgi:hypothetical protein